MDILHKLPLARTENLTREGFAQQKSEEIV